MHNYNVVQQLKLHDLCATFPSTPDCEIYRDHLLDTFERVFSGPVDLLVLEGDQGTGKTTLLSQFARRYPKRSISSFVTPIPRYNYDYSTLISDYTAQIMSILEPGKSFTQEPAGDGILQRIIQKLKRRRGAVTYFLFDGLTDITDEVIMNEVTNLLPIGQGFPVIVSGEAKSLPSRLANSRRTKITQTVNFSLAEVYQYLSDFRLSDTQTRQIYQECGKGIPANLSSIRRSLLAGVDLKHLQGLSIRGLFEQEWQIAVADKLSTEIVAMVAHSRHRLTTDSLSDILKVDNKSVLSRLQKIPFLQMDNASYVSFVSNAFADFAFNRLSNRKRDVIGKLVGHLLEAGMDGTDAADRLPAYLQETGRLKDVISFLSPDYFSNTLNRTESFAPLRKQFRIGVDVSAQRRDDGSLIRFGLGSSAIMEIESSQVSRSEVEALVTTDQIEKTLSLAANCPLREDRLHLLAVVARCEKELGMPVSDEIIDQIKLLYGQVDAVALNDKAIDIAADLFPCCPDLAIKLIEHSSQENDHENELDIAYLRLSIATAVRQIKLNDDKDDLEMIRKRIKDPRLRGFTSTLFGNVQTADDVIAEAERLETASDRLYVLRKWSVEHSDRDDAVDVAVYGLNTIVEATDYSPNARVLRELSTPLSHVKESRMAQSLVRSFDGQRTTVEGQGPTEEVVRMQLNLAFAESIYDRDACANRLVEVYLTIDELKDISTKSSCFARLLSTLQVIDSSGEIEKREQLKSLSRDAMDAAISELLDHTAHQVEVTRRVIDALASFAPSQAFALAERLNTSFRREEALLLAIDATLENGPVDIGGVREACGRLQRSDSRDHVAASVAEYLVQKASSGETSVAESGYDIFRDFFFAVSNPIERCRVLCLLYALSEHGVYTEDMQADLLRQIKGTLNDLDSGWIEIDVRFRLARAFASWRPVQAKTYLRDADDRRKRTALSSFSSEWTFQACLRLSMRAFAGQLGHRYDPEDDISRIGELIERLPNTSMQAQLWGELAMHLYLKSRSDDGNRIVYEHVTPLLNLIPDGPTRDSTVISVSPALFRSHKTTAIESFSALERHHRDSALMTCAEFILEKHIPSDPYEKHESGYPITFQDAVDVAELADEIQLDGMVYSLIAALADTLAPKGANTKFTRQQQANLVLRIKNLVNRKFPDPDNIRHDGFKIASEAQCLRIERAPRQDWDTVIDRAKSIPNRSDRSYVLAIIGKILPASVSDRSKPLFEEAINDARSIPCNYDRLARLNDLAALMVRRSGRLARECLREAITGFQSAGDNSGGRITREIIDTAFKIDADFAASLVPLLDDDPARTMAREEMKRRVGILRRKKAIVDGLESWERSESGYPDLPNSAWLALGSLNAGRVNALAMDQLRPALRYAGRYTLRDGFPILAWTIENVTRRSSGSPESRSIIRSIFEGTMSATELVELAATSASITARRPASALRVTPTDRNMVMQSGETIVIQRGERSRATSLVDRWLRRSASGHLYICDQYFQPADLELLMLIQSAVPDIDITVLTSRRCHQPSAIFSLSESYRYGWKKISDQTPPKAEIVVVGMETSGKSPIHDRCILSEASGIILGTSWNSLGLSQDSIMRELSERELSEMSQHVEKFILNRTRVHGGERLLYDTVTL